MAGLNSIISNTGQQTTTLPSWFDTAQQNVVSQAGQAFNSAPSPQNTVAQNAVNSLSGPTNPFTQATSTLQSIASGAANPWIVTPQYAQPNMGIGYGGSAAPTAQTQPSSQYSPFAATQPGDDFGGGRAGAMSAGFSTMGDGTINRSLTPMSAFGAGGLGSGLTAADLASAQAQGNANFTPQSAMAGEGAGNGTPTGQTTQSNPLMQAGYNGSNAEPSHFDNPLGQPTGYNVAPNPNTALGGLFAAQNQQLQQLAPNIMDPVTAGGTGSGQFGSLRTQTAADKALADAQANLFAQQNQAALQNQATGVQAGIGAGTVGQENINNLLQTGQYQQAAPFINASNYGKILGGIQAPTTVNNQTQLSPLNQIAGLVSALGGPAGTTGLLAQLGITNGLQGLINKFPGFSSGSTNNSDIPPDQVTGPDNIIPADSGYVAPNVEE